MRAGTATRILALATLALLSSSCNAPSPASAAAPSSPPRGRPLSKAEALQVLREQVSSDYHKLARCWLATEVDNPEDRNSTADICRAMVAVGYLDPRSMRPTKLAFEKHQHEFYWGSPNLTMHVARRRFVDVTRVTLPPPEAFAAGMKGTRRVEFTWRWTVTNRLGTYLRVPEDHDNQGVAYIRPEGATDWILKKVEYVDTTPDLFGRWAY